MSDIVMALLCLWLLDSLLDWPWNAPFPEVRIWQRCLPEAGAPGSEPWRRVGRWAAAKTTSSGRHATHGDFLALASPCQHHPLLSHVVLNNSLVPVNFPSHPYLNLLILNPYGSLLPVPIGQMDIPKVVELLCFVQNL